MYARHHLTFRKKLGQLLMFSDAGLQYLLLAISVLYSKQFSLLIFSLWLLLFELSQQGLICLYACWLALEDKSAEALQHLQHTDGSTTPGTMGHVVKRLCASIAL